MVDEVSLEVRAVANEWDDWVAEFDAAYGAIEQADERAREILEKLNLLQQKCAALESQPGGEYLQSIRDVDLNKLESEVNAVEWGYAGYELPRSDVPAPDEPDEDESGEGATPA
jgi:hypothetical protein